MIKVYDFRCNNGHHFEQFVEQDISTSRCGCGADAKRIVSATKCYLDGSDQSFPGAAMRWEREHEKAGKAGKSAEQG